MKCGYGKAVSRISAGAHRRLRARAGTPAAGRKVMIERLPVSLSKSITEAEFRYRDPILGFRKH